MVANTRWSQREVQLYLWLACSSVLDNGLKIASFLFSTEKHSLPSFVCMHVVGLIYLDFVLAYFAYNHNIPANSHALGVSLTPAG